MDGVTSCGIDCISALGRARLDGHGRDCVVSSPLLPAVGWSSFSRLRPAGSRSLDACAATCHLPVGLSSCAFWCCPKASFCAFFWSWYFAEVPGRGRVLCRSTRPGPCTFAAGGILEGYFARRACDPEPQRKRRLRSALVSSSVPPSLELELESVLSSSSCRRLRSDPSRQTGCSCSESVSS